MSDIFNNKEHNYASANSNDSDDSTWVAGAIEIQLREGLQPEVGLASNGVMCEFTAAVETAADTLPSPLSALNEVLLKHDCQEAIAVFDTTVEDMAETQAMALEQDMEVPDLSGFYTLHFPPERDVWSIAEELREVPEVLHANPLPKIKPAGAGPLSDLNELLGLNDQMTDKQWYIFRCRIDRAWALGYTGKGVVVADIDWGFLTTHPDLAPHLNLEMAYNSEDGTDQVSQGGALKHGTGVLGLVGAAANAGGMVGIAHGAELWPIQVNTTSDLVVRARPWARAIYWVTLAPSGDKRKVMIIEGQTSKGRNITQIHSVRAAIQHAIARGIVVCVPAGNGNHQVELDDADRCFTPVGIIVGATTFDDKPFEVTNFGASVVVSAPGDELFDLTCNDDLNDLYRFDFGATSGATAKVAGVVALILEANPRLTHADIKEILSTTGTRITSKELGNLLDCEEAVRAALSL